MKGRLDSGFSSSDRIFIREVHEYLFGYSVRNTRCSECYRDAYILIMYKLKKDGTMPKEKKFILSNGVLLHAFNGEVFTNANLTDEIAMDAINENAGRISLFAKVPDNYKELCVARKTLVEEEAAKGVGKSKEELQYDVDSLKSALETAQADIKALQTTGDELELKIVAANEAKTTLEGIVKELETKVAALTSQNESLTTENEALTEAKTEQENTNKSLENEVAVLKQEITDAAKTVTKKAEVKTEGKTA